MPRTDSPTVNVRASLPGASAEEIETTITRPIEAAVNTINGIDELRCSSNQGNGNCTITFVLERDIEAATQDVRDKVATVRFPRDTEPPVVSKIDPDAAPILTLVVFSNRSPKEITQIADKQIKQVLETVQDVGEVALLRRPPPRDPHPARSEPAQRLRPDRGPGRQRGRPPEHRDSRRQLHRRPVRVLDAHHGPAARRRGVREDRAASYRTARSITLGDVARSPTRTRKSAARRGSTAKTPSRCRSASSPAPTPSRRRSRAWRALERIQATLPSDIKIRADPRSVALHPQVVRGNPAPPDPRRLARGAGRVPLHPQLARDPHRRTRDPDLDHRDVRGHARRSASRSTT